MWQRSGFGTVTIHGKQQAGRQPPALVWNYRPAATLKTWKVTRDMSSGRPKWTLVATIDRMFAFELRQPGLIFRAERTMKPAGFWIWPVLGAPRVIGLSLSANLGPPEGH